MFTRNLSELKIVIVQNFSESWYNENYNLGNRWWVYGCIQYTCTHTYISKLLIQKIIILISLLFSTLLMSTVRICTVLYCIFVLWFNHSSHTDCYIVTLVCDITIWIIFRNINYEYFTITSQVHASTAVHV